MILEPGQRKLVRVAEVAPPGERERVYRVTVKPVFGEISADQSGLKILLGYDVLILVRPAQPEAIISAMRSGDSVTFRNDGNVSVELEHGRQCDATGTLFRPARKAALRRGSLDHSGEARLSAAIHAEIAGPDGAKDLLSPKR